MMKNDYTLASELASWRGRVLSAWPGLYLSGRLLQNGTRHVGESVEVEAVLHAQGLPHDDLRVELVYSLEEDELKRDIHRVAMQCTETYGDGGSLYKAVFEPHISGRLAYGVRVYPVHEGLASPFDVHAIRWA